MATARCLEMQIEHGSAQDLYPCPVGGARHGLHQRQMPLSLPVSVALHGIFSMVQ